MVHESQRQSFLLSFRSPGPLTVVTIERQITAKALLLRDGIEIVEEIIKMFLAIRERQRELGLLPKSMSLWVGIVSAFGVCPALGKWDIYILLNK